jgi:4-amino-4-deoxy-L-arabinose transferase-like glycosyltransferase
MNQSDRRSHDRLILGVLLLIGLALRLGWALSRSGDLAALPDQAEYLALGRNLLHAGTLAFFDPRFGQTLWAYRMPGYPAFIALCGGAISTIRVMQAIVDTGTVLAVYLLAKRVLSARLITAPIWAAAIVAINPYLIYFTGLVLTETLFTAIIAWGMVLLATPNEDQRPRPFGSRAAVYGALLLALSILVRPEAVLLPCVLAVAAMGVNNIRYGTYDSRVRRALIQAAVMLPLLFVALVLLPWGYRNQHVLGRPIWFTTDGGITLYDGNHPGADGSSDQSFLADMPELKSKTEVERNADLTTRATDFIIANPAEAISLAFRKIARTWSPMPLSTAFGSRRNVEIGLAYSLPFDVLVLLGLISQRVPRSAKVFLMMPAIYLTVVHMISVGSLRYRLPAEPPMAIMAAVVLSKMLPESKAQRS